MATSTITVTSSEIIEMGHRLVKEFGVSPIEVLIMSVQPDVGELFVGAIAAFEDMKAIGWA
jgi:hypothetical protein